MCDFQYGDYQLLETIEYFKKRYYNWRNKILIYFDLNLNSNVCQIFFCYT